MAIKSIRADDAVAEVIDRIHRVTPASERRWGRMDHAQLFVHLADGLRLALGHGKQRPSRGIMRFPPLRYLVIHKLSWPKGKAKAPPGAFERPPTTWEEDRQTLLDLLAQYVDTPGDQLGRRHPLFGRLRQRDWDVLVYRHLDHHLRQFGA